MKLPKSRPSSRQGFTLVELLTVIAIIGILAGLLVPGVMMAKKIAQKAAAGNSCAQIAKAYSMHANSGTNPRNISVENAGTFGAGVTGWAGYLAAKTKINEPDIWFVKQDSQLDNVQSWPKTIVNLANPAQITIDPVFQAASPKSWAVVANAMKNPSNPTAYPVVWTRGLQGETWVQQSPWAGEGGHVGFLDGHQVWLDNTRDEENGGRGAFLNQSTQQPTSSIQDAIGRTAQILEDK